MFLRRFLTKHRNDEPDADRNLPARIDRTPPPKPYVPNATTAPTHNLPGRDCVSPPEYSPTTDTLGVADASQVATQNYSKRPSEIQVLPPVLICLNFVSILQDICRGRSYSLEDTRSR